MQLMWLLCASLLLFYIGYIFALGTTILNSLGLKRGDNDDILVALGTGTFGLALLGLVVALSPVSKWVTALVALCFSLVVVARSITSQPQLFWRFLLESRVVLSLWLLTALVAISLTFYPARKPDQLYDGPYVFKVWNLPVQIQALTGNLPPDNALPAVVTEYLVRDISFSRERPIMPGQEVSNRPILLALAAAPARAIFGDSTAQSVPLPRFKYAGSEWPDTMTLISDSDFRIFLVIGVALNALVAVAFYRLLSVVNVSYRIALTIVFCALSPYVILHTMFTWPKNLAAFFIIASLIMLHTGRDRAGIAGVFMGLAYWSHPYALAFLAITIAFLALKQAMLFGTRDEWSVFIKFSTISCAFVLVWIFWSQIYLGIPSDLVVQNQTSAGVLGSIWIRFYNGYLTLFPTFFDVQPFYAPAVIQKLLISVWAPMGLLILVLPAAIFDGRDSVLWAIFTVAAVSGAALIAVFGTPTVPLLHGWQAVWPVLASMSVLWIAKRENKYILGWLVAAQCGINLSVFAAWGSIYGAA